MAEDFTTGFELDSDLKPQGPAPGGSASGGGGRGKGTKKKNSKKKTLLLLLLLFVGVGGLSTVLYLKFGVKQPIVYDDATTPRRYWMVGNAKEGTPGMTKNQIVDAMNAVDKTKINISVNTRPVFPDGKSEGTLYIINPASNGFEMLCKIILNDTGEEIYNSGGIAPNHFIDLDKLSKELPAGEYPATAVLDAFDPDNPDMQLNTASVDLTIVIQR